MGETHFVARELCRSVAFEPASADEPSDGRTLTGYAAVFGESTEIDSWEGRFTESIRHGAFRKSLRERTPVMQFDHGRHPLIGSIPIGAIEDIREDDHGLYTEGRISDNWLMQPIRDAIAEGSVSGMSFRFEVVREKWTDVNGKPVREEDVPGLLWMPDERGPLHRELVELKVREVGPVVFPAYEGTEVGVRAAHLAEEMTRDNGLIRKVRQSLARDANYALDGVGPEDPELLREVAAQLLFRADAPPEQGHPSPQDARDDGAPPDEGHPPQYNDAPPSDGHPSPSPSQERLRSQIREIAALMGERLAHIDSKENS